MLRKLLKVLFFVLLVPVAIPLILLVALLVIGAAFFTNIVRPIQIRWHAWRTGTWTYLVCSPRRGWHEFVANNLRAALPERVALVWSKGNGSGGQCFNSKLFAGYGRGIAKPCLVEVRPLRSARIRSLHRQLLPLKAFARKNTEVQQRLRELLEAELLPR